MNFAFGRLSLLFVFLTTWDRCQFAAGQKFLMLACTDVTKELLHHKVFLTRKKTQAGEHACLAGRQMSNKGNEKEEVEAFQLVQLVEI